MFRLASSLCFATRAALTAAAAPAVVPASAELLAVLPRRMAGHSQFANRKHIKGANDLKRAQLFTRLAREIAAAVKTGGPNPEHNPKLRTAIEHARKGDMPKARIDSAIAKGSGQGADDAKPLLLEVTGPNALFLLIEAEVAQREQVIGELRRELRKIGGTIGKEGSAVWAFERVGVIRFGREQLKRDEASGGDEWDLEELAIEVDANEVADTGADEDSETAGFVKLLCDADKLRKVEDALADLKIDVAEATVTYISTKPAALTEEQNRQLDNALENISKSEYVTRIIDNRM